MRAFKTSYPPTYLLRITCLKCIFSDGESIPISRQTKAMSLFLNVLEISVIALPFAVFVLLTMDPCTPPFLLSMSDRCGKMNCMKFGPEIFVILFEAYMTLQLACSGSTWPMYVLFTGIETILNYSQLLKRL